MHVLCMSLHIVDPLTPLLFPRSKGLPARACGNLPSERGNVTAPGAPRSPKRTPVQIRQRSESLH